MHYLIEGTTSHLPIGAAPGAVYYVAEHGSNVPHTVLMVAGVEELIDPPTLGVAATGKAQQLKPEDFA